MKLELKQGQKHQIYQKQIEKNQILQMDVQQLLAHIEKISFENPLIDTDDMIESTSDIGKEFDIDSLSRKSEQSLKENIHWQLINKDIDNKELVESLVELLDDNGYLRLSIEDICTCLKCDEKEYIEAKNALSKLEPPGLGAVTLKECLLLQLERLEETEDIYKTKQLIEECLEDLSKSHYHAVSKKLGISQNKVRELLQIILTLNPRPASGFSSSIEVNYPVPDIIIKDNAVQLNPVIYKDININTSYLSLESESKETKKYIESKLKQVSWLQQCLTQRKNLLYDIAVFLLDYQQDFFMNGGTCHPLMQKDLAMLLGVHESTISRAIKDKYIYCDKGFILLSDLIPRGTEDTSVDSIKETIKEVILNEDKNKPLSDQKITNLLKEKGIEISRRTVAKYRSELNIPDASGRKHVKK
ncbi:RNA polymerase factor sigma-54 [Catenibacterium mitsuokai]|uniref:RNA polymerase factor sigma-54 n=1 Tax=Catenibacterium mitsuokai TaxID=100886 RepID=A0AAW4MS27_9FIRM|nr:MULTISPECIES: RNA polymerase factor sigma-54 [Catenibacterium]MBV3366919.1 RNA polymerase factor sigma-54 [Catenibacterium mitsuokai]MBV3371020.1 RNA polymerase factor sigma-54 [Catenibacterium mitsuokai]MBV3376340.1 RNA polymerase factor sigma-54 [Catenibacterium mitsuokai]MBV3378168.1 RNA polymerase factor sigma-54 [Catenibacterium mitsuokai]MBV3381252.1 RNA polymerase factor sigma-54 [Catenibacterium mitsuokai]